MLSFDDTSKIQAEAPPESVHRIESATSPKTWATLVAKNAVPKTWATLVARNATPHDLKHQIQQSCPAPPVKQQPSTVRVERPCFILKHALLVQTVPTASERRVSGDRLLHGVRDFFIRFTVRPFCCETLSRKVYENFIESTKWFLHEHV